MPALGVWLNFIVHENVNIALPSAHLARLAELQIHIPSKRLFQLQPPFSLFISMWPERIQTHLTPEAVRAVRLARPICSISGLTAPVLGSAV